MTTDWIHSIHAVGQTACDQDARAALVSETHAVQQQGLDFLIADLSVVSHGCCSASFQCFRTL